MMADHVFVSYKHNEKEFADMLIGQLHAANFNVWLDTEQLRAGENWRESINHAIKESFAMIVVITPDAKTSEFVTYEWAFAQGAGIKVIPIMLSPTKLHPQLEMLQYLDFTDRARPPWDRLIRRLAEVRGEQQPKRVESDAPPAIKSAVAALDSHNAEERRSALRTLAQINHPAAYDAMVNAVKHPMRDVRVDAGFMLAKQTQHKDPAAVPGLLDALGDDDPRIRTAAVKALGEIGDPAAVPQLLHIMNTERDGDIRWLATGALGKIGAAAVPGLLNMLRDEDWKVRRSAADALWAMREPSAVPGLLAALQDRNDVVRQAVAGALEAIGEGAVVPLIEALNSRDPQTSRIAADYLNKIATPEALNAVRQWTIKTTSKLDEKRGFPPRR
jgi:HEAT repeat protein